MYSRKLQVLWKSKIPLKVRIFLWLCYHDRVQTLDQLSKRGWKGDNVCVLCGCEETLNHILFTCHLALFFWLGMKEILSWERAPISFDDFQLNWLEQRGSNDYNFVLFSFAASVWILWKCRNRMAFDKHFPKQPMEVIFNFMSCLQRWSALLNSDDRDKMNCFLMRVENWSKTL